MKRDPMEATESAAEETAESPSDEQLEMHAQDLMRAHKIQQDKPLMKHVAKHMSGKIQSMKNVIAPHMPTTDKAHANMKTKPKSIADLKAKRNKMFQDPIEDQDV